ncbi:MAG: hypothetical protein HY901_02125 [Deltaproteobacteria bacterium]|nr:hypothetical protein [Deltaproteobacteria bacterium]
MNVLLLALVLAANSTPGTSGVGEAVAGLVEPQALGAQEAVEPSPNEVGAVTKGPSAGGIHWRLMTERGPIHVWRPQGFDARTAGTLVYLHGYYTNADEAWALHRLAEQFRTSRRNALFVVPEAPVGIPDRVRFPDLGALLETVQSQLKVPIPAGPVAVMGHSGAFRTVVGWLSEPRLEQITLLDGLYNCEAEFLAWLKADPRPPSGRRMVLVGFETAERSAAFVAAIPEALYRDGIPASGSQFRRRERVAKLLYVHSQYDHMGIVTEARAIPSLLRLAPFNAL